MEKHIYTFEELQSILDDYNSTDIVKHSASLVKFNDLIQDFIDDKCDIDKNNPEAIQKFIDLIKFFNNSQESMMSESYLKALAKIESFVNQTNEVLDNITGNRIYSLMSDENQIKFNILTLSVYQEMGLVDKDLDYKNMTPGQVIDAIDSVNLTSKQREEYADKFTEKIINDEDLFNLVPPKILTDAYIFVRKGLTNNKKDKNLLKKYEKLSKRIDYLIGNFAQQVDYFVSDPSNIADVYSGYRKMCEIRGKDLKVEKSDNESTKKYKQQVSNNINETLRRLNEIVNDYREMFNIKDLKSQDADKLNERWEEIKNILKDININDDTLSVLSKYQFLDENDKPLPQFIDENGVEHLDFKPGYKLKQDGRLARIISLAKNDVNMFNIGDLDKDVKDIDLESQLNEIAKNKLEYITKIDQEFQKAKHDGNISDIGYQSGLDYEVNKIAGFAGLLADEIGNDKDVLFKPFEAVEDIDKLAKSRTEKTGAQGRKQKVSFFKRAIKNFGMAAVYSAGLTFIGKATGISYLGAAIGTTIGIGNIVYQGFKWSKEQKKNGKPHDLLTFFKDKRNYAPAITSGLGIAAVICMATGNTGLATGFGLGAMGVGGTSSAVMMYKDAMAAGYTRGQALAGALGMIGSTVAGAFTGRFAMDSLINYVNNHTDSNLFKHETTIVKSEEHTERVYNDGVIDHHKEMMLKHHWETPQSYETRIDGLMNAGLSHDDAVRYLLAWHDATDHNLGGRYFNNIGLSADALADFRASISGAGINITQDAMNAFEKFNPHISILNQVGHIDGAPILHNLPANATYDANGIAVTGKDFYTTYANGPSAFQDIVIPAETESVFTPNELSWYAGMGTMGIYEPRVVGNEYVDVLKERAGSLADRLNKDTPYLNNEENENNNSNNLENTESNNANNNQTDTNDVVNTGEESGNQNNHDIQGNNDGTDVYNSTDRNDGRDVNPAPYGFFGTCKDVIYKIMQATKSGMKKTVKGLHQINTQIIQNIGESATQIQKEVLTMKQEREVLKNKHKMIVLSGEEERQLKILEEEIKREKVKLQGELEMATLEQKHDIESRLREYDGLIESVEKYKKIGGQEGIDSVIALQKLENKLKRLRAKGDHDVEIDEVLTKAKIEDIKARSKNNVFRLAGRRIAGFFKGMKDKDKEDIKTEINATKLLQEKLKQSKTKFDKTVWDSASKKLQDLLSAHKYTGEEMDKLIDYIIKEAKNQIKE